MKKIKEILDELERKTDKGHGGEEQCPCYIGFKKDIREIKKKYLIGRKNNN